MPVRDLRWSDSGELVAIISESSFYILRLDSQAVDSFLASGEEAEDNGLEDAFELLNEVSERVRTGEIEALVHVTLIFGLITALLVTGCTQALICWCIAR